MKSIIAVITTIVVLILIGNVQATSHPHAYGGIPSDEAFIERNAYIMQFDQQTTCKINCYFTGQA